MKHRLERVNEVIRRELSDLISREVLLSSKVLVTIPAVSITADLRQCYVYVSVIGRPEDKTQVIAQLEAERIALQADLSKRVVLKYTPHLYFRLDESIERGNRVLEIIQDLDQRDETGLGE
ncbi:MAG: 30S ribosome-binding factor RbfA [Verrucomicrobia bacterium]|nr:30S ribosome-binding factor RbfA [Verrucomicrobiota bacterium]